MVTVVDTVGFWWCGALTCLQSLDADVEGQRRTWLYTAEVVLFDLSLAPY